MFVSKRYTLLLYRLLQQHEFITIFYNNRLLCMLIGIPVKNIIAIFGLLDLAQNRLYFFEFNYLLSLHITQNYSNWVDICYTHILDDAVTIDAIPRSQLLLYMSTLKFIQEKIWQKTVQLWKPFDCLITAGSALNQSYSTQILTE